MLWFTVSPTLYVNPFLNVIVQKKQDMERYIDEVRRFISKLRCTRFLRFNDPSYSSHPNQCLREGSSESEVKGGILAEQMGLGKTVEVLALVLKNPLPPRAATPLPSTKFYTPPVLKDYKPDLSAVCICGNHQPKRSNNCLVVCSRCGDWNHSRCVGFAHPRDVVGGECSPDSQCFTCIAEACHDNPIKSRATLIVTPPALTNQWLAEIAKHTKNLKVCVFDGVKEISRHAGADLSLLNPINLADHDIILTTFGTLQADLGHSDKNPYSSASGKREGRGKRKKYRVFPSPLTSINFWR